MPAIRPTRRQLLKGLSAALGAAAFSQVAGCSRDVDVALDYTPSSDTEGRVGQLFSADALRVLRDVCAQVIPATDTPGAHELDVHGFIDNQLFHCYDADAQALAVRLLDAIDAGARSQFGAAFTEAGRDAQLELLTDLERASGGFSPEQRQHFKYLKNLVVFGYLTTEVGGTRLLAWDPFPGGFTGSVPYASVGRAWLGNVT